MLVATAAAPTPRKPILTIRGLQKHYSIEPNLYQRLFDRAKATVVRAVDNIDLELYEGEIFGLVGESGCGKSTFARTILQLIPATAGTVTFDSENLTQLSSTAIHAKQRDIQLIWPDPSASLNPIMTVGESIADSLEIHKINTTLTETKTQVLAMLARVGLNPAPEYYDRCPEQLSIGQQQRVAIARALIIKPKLVIFDEPLGMLEAAIQSEILELMLTLKREANLTYLFLTHDFQFAKLVCDRIAVMDRGRIVEIADTWI